MRQRREPYNVTRLQHHLLSTPTLILDDVDDVLKSIGLLVVLVRVREELQVLLRVLDRRQAGGSLSRRGISGLILLIVARNVVFIEREPVDKAPEDVLDCAAISLRVLLLLAPQLLSAVRGLSFLGLACTSCTLDVGDGLLRVRYTQSKRDLLKSEPVRLRRILDIRGIVVLSSELLLLVLIHEDPVANGEGLVVESSGQAGGHGGHGYRARHER
jgi:hypothetical protein